MGLPEELRTHRRRAWRGDAASCARDLAAALVDDPPHLKRDGGFVREGYRASSTRRAA